MTGDPDAGIQAEAVHKTFGRVVALDGLDLTVPAGAMLALLGPNGAGKSTFTKVCTTLLRPDSGTVRVAGFDVVRAPDRVRAATGVAGQSATVDKELTGRETLHMLARLYGCGNRAATARAAEMLDRFDLGAVADRRAATYSGGTRRRLDLAAALIGQPRVVFLDEPTVGLDPRSRTEVWDLLATFGAAGVTVLLATQHLEEAEHLTDRIVVIDHGRVLVTDTIERLKQRYGDHRLAVVVRHPEDVGPAERVLAGLGSGPVAVDRRLHRVAVTLPDGVDRIGTAAHRLAEAGVRVADLAVRRPTLEEVFFAITSAAPDPVGAVEGGTR